MSYAAPGNYYIVNKVISSTGERLALTSNGRDKPITVTPLTKANNQIWTISGYTDIQQLLKPKSDSNLEAANGPNASGQLVLKTLPAHLYLVQIVSTDTGYNIRVGVPTHPSGIDSAVNGAEVVMRDETGSFLQRWVLIPA